MYKLRLLCNHLNSMLLNRSTEKESFWIDFNSLFLSRFLSHMVENVTQLRVKSHI